MKQLVYIVIGFCLLFAGCNYLDQVPEGDIETEETIFEKKSQAEEWLQTCHVFLSEHLTSLVKEPSRVGTDEVVAGDYIRKFYLNKGKSSALWDGFFIADGLQMAWTCFRTVSGCHWNTLPCCPWYMPRSFSMI